MDDKVQQTVENLKNNPAMIQALFRSRDGQNLLRLLTQGDRGAALQQATRSAVQGDTSEMVQLVSQVMQSPEGAELVERINRAVQK